MFGIDRRAWSKRRRSWFRRPDPREVGERLGWLLKRMENRATLKSGWRRDQWVAKLEMHPAAPLVTITLGADAEITVRGETGGIGPGYHADIVARLTRVLDEIDYVWADHEPDPQDAMTAWLVSELAGQGQIRIGLPDRTFHTDAPVLTPLGPRDAAWKANVLAHPRDGADAFSWWKPGKGQAARSRALLAMWLEVPWREPIDDAELDLMKQVDDDLLAAHAADPTLELPDVEWAEILGYLNSRDEHVAKVRARAAGRKAQIGYRRYDMDVELSGGWVVRLPGSFVGKWEDDDARYWATDGDRVIEFTSLTAEGEGDSDKLLAVAPERHPVADRFSDGERRGRAEVYDEDYVHIVHGLVASAPHVAILTCKSTVANEPWALATWRSLRRS